MRERETERQRERERERERESCTFLMVLFKHDVLPRWGRGFPELLNGLCAATLIKELHRQTTEPVDVFTRQRQQDTPFSIQAA